jgi:hypothetical protein
MNGSRFWWCDWCNGCMNTMYAEEQK